MDVKRCNWLPTGRLRDLHPGSMTSRSSQTDVTSSSATTRSGADPWALRRVADQLLDKAEQGDVAYIHELIERLDGTPARVNDRLVV